jgi:hypothetical protein
MKPLNKRQVIVGLFIIVGLAILGDRSFFIGQSKENFCERIYCKYDF